MDIDRLIEAAESGDYQSAVKLQQMYEAGDGVKKDRILSSYYGDMAREILERGQTKKEALSSSNEAVQKEELSSETKAVVSSVRSKKIPILIIVLLIALVLGTAFYLGIRGGERSDADQGEKQSRSSGETAKKSQETDKDKKPEDAYKPGIHQYKLVPAKKIDAKKYKHTWTGFRKYCESQYKEGVQGHMVTFETDEEYQYVIRNVIKGSTAYYEVPIGAVLDKDDYSFAWISGEDSASDVYRVEEGDARWADSEPSYTEEDKRGNTYDDDRVMLFRNRDGWYFMDVPDNFLKLAPEYKSLYVVVEYELSPDKK